MRQRRMACAVVLMIAMGVSMCGTVYADGGSGDPQNPVRTASTQNSSTQGATSSSTTTNTSTTTDWSSWLQLPSWVYHVYVAVNGFSGS